MVGKLGSVLSTMGKSEYYSILFLRELARGKKVSLVEMSRRYDIPLDFMYKIASRLKASGIISSKEGVKGGYRLNISSPSLYDITHALKEKKDVLCSCTVSSCGKHAVCESFTGMQKELQEKLKEIKLF